MTKTMTINDFLMIFPEIEKLFMQDKCFKINTALKMLNLYKNSDEINSYILNRIRELIPNIAKSGYTMTEDEVEIYEAILSSTIDVENYGLTKDELIQGSEAEISAKGLEKLLTLV